MYDGAGPCLKRGVADRFSNLFGAVAICGGFDYNFVKRIDANLNE